jgi:hypothetical protein
MFWLPAEKPEPDEPHNMVAMIERLNIIFGGEDLRDVSQETHPS